MFAPAPASAPDTAATIPGRSGQEMTRRATGGGIEVSDGLADMDWRGEAAESYQTSGSPPAGRSETMRSMTFAGTDAAEAGTPDERV